MKNYSFLKRWQDFFASRIYSGRELRYNPLQEYFEITKPQTVAGRTKLIVYYCSR